MVKLNLIERLIIKKASFNGEHLIAALRVWSKKRGRYIDKFNKTGLEKYEYLARQCWNEYCHVLDVITYFNVSEVLNGA